MRVNQLWTDAYAKAVRTWTDDVVQQTILLVSNSGMPYVEDVLDVLYAELSRRSGTECAS